MLIIGYKTKMIGEKIFNFIWCKVCECYKQQITSQLKGSVYARQLYFYYLEMLMVSVYIPIFATPRISPCNLYKEYLCKYDDLSSSIWCVGSTDLNARFENNSSVYNCQQVYKSKR